jgi:hypothetical protein
MRPTLSQALQIVAGSPRGLTSAALARRLNTRPSVASGLASRLSRLGRIRSTAAGARYPQARLWLPLDAALRSAIAPPLPGWPETIPSAAQVAALAPEIVP